MYNQKSNLIHGSEYKNQHHVSTILHIKSFCSTLKYIPEDLIRIENIEKTQFWKKKFLNKILLKYEINCKLTADSNIIE